jgi:hypothetical protein
LIFPLLCHRQSDGNQEEVKDDDRTHELVNDLQVDLEIVTLELGAPFPDIVCRDIFGGTVSARQHASSKGSELQVSGIILCHVEGVKVRRGEG